MEEIYSPHSAEMPVEVEEAHLPDRVPAKAVYGLREILKTGSQRHVAEQMNTTPNSVGVMIDSLENENLLDTEGGRGRGKEYHLTEKGAEALWSLRNGIKSAQEEEEFIPEKLRSFEHFSRYHELEPQDIAVFLYTIGYDKLGEIEENTYLESREITNSRDNLDPFLEDKGNKYSPDYYLNNQGRALLGHLYALEKEGSLWKEQDREDEESIGWEDFTKKQN